MNKEEIKISKNWLSALKVNSEFEAISKEIILQYIEQLEKKEKRLKYRLEKDIVNITKILQDGKHCDDYSKCRLKAYRTKTKEILKLIGGSYE